MCTKVARRGASSVGRPYPRTRRRSLRPPRCTASAANTSSRRSGSGSPSHWCPALTSIEPVSPPSADSCSCTTGVSMTRSPSCPPPSSGARAGHLPCLATRAEALVLAGRDGAREAIAEALSLSVENPLARAIALRARAQLDGDEAALQESFDTLQRIGCPHQAARSGWLLGGDARRAAEEMLERLKVPLPQSDRV